WLKVAVSFALARARVGRTRNAAAVAAWLLITRQQGIIRCVSGHGHHSDVCLLYAAYLLALFPIADALASKRWAMAPPTARPRTERVLVVAILTLLCLSYTLT